MYFELLAQCFFGLNAFPLVQPTVSKHLRKQCTDPSLIISSSTAKLLMKEHCCFHTNCLTPIPQLLKRIRSILFQKSPILQTTSRPLCVVYCILSSGFSVWAAKRLPKLESMSGSQRSRGVNLSEQPSRSSGCCNWSLCCFSSSLHCREDLLLPNCAVHSDSNNIRCFQYVNIFSYIMRWLDEIAVLKYLQYSASMFW